MELLECALLRSRIELWYRTAGSSDEKRREVDPHALTNRDGVWYLVAYDHRRRKMVPFNVSRIVRFRPTGESFERDPAFDLEAHFTAAFSVMRGDRPAQKVRIRFSPEKAHFAREREFHPTQVLVEIADGGAGPTNPSRQPRGQETGPPFEQCVVNESDQPRVYPPEGDER